MKRLKILIITLISVLCLVGCGQTRNYAAANTETEEYYYGASVETDDGMKAYIYYYTAKQVDSMCVVDKLPRNLDEWICEKYLDFEYSRYVIKRMYIKEFGDDAELIYLLIPREELYKVTKRYVNCDPDEINKKNRRVKKWNGKEPKLIKDNNFSIKK